MKRQILSLSLALSLLALFAPARASVITVSGDQTGTWSADTVIVTAEVRVPPNMSLTILPGVEVLFSVYCKLIVDSAATLQAVGTPVDSIRFDVMPPNVIWHGIRFLSASDSSRLEYCHLTHGLTSGGGQDYYGGAVYCSSSRPIISHNTIRANSASGSYPLLDKGGGIACFNSSPTISSNTIFDNFAQNSGGIYCNRSSPIISNNFINGNTAISNGGGIYCDDNSNPIIEYNIISENSTEESGLGGGIYCKNNSNPAIICNTINHNGAPAGSGIYCFSSNPIINGNTINENSTSIGNVGGNGGGIYCNSSSPVISDNTIIGNSASLGSGGGIYCFNSSPTIGGNIISRNGATHLGGGINSFHSSPLISGNTIFGNQTGGMGPFGGGINCDPNTTVINCILWENGDRPITGSPMVTYSDIQGGYTGTGNINVYPAFVDTAQDDYRLQWGSPCIDSGDPNPLYNDPDLTRADMGAFYYDQSMPVRVLLIPLNTPIQIPASGGSFQFTLNLTNVDDVVYNTTIWCNVTLPSGNIYGPVLGPITIPLSSQILSTARTQIIPANAPAGIYHYKAFAAAARDTSTDGFTFTKAGGGDWGLGAGGWINTGEEFMDGGTPSVASKKDMTEHVPPSIFPNPFNPLTTISYQLPDQSFVNLSVYDISGKKVAVLVNGMREAGAQGVTFDASGLASGVYLCRLKAGDATVLNKMVLMK